MAQFARPEADIVNQSYTNELASGSNLYQSIDESVASDSDYIVSDLAPTDDVYTCRLSDLEDPLTNTGHIFRYRVRKNSAAGSRIDVTVELRQDYVDESNKGTLIATDDQTDISETATTFAYTLEAAEADSITDYTSLFLRFVFNQP